MRIILGILFLNLILPLSAGAENGIILKCRVDNARWKSVFQLDAVGIGFLKFKKIGDDKSYTCGLKLEYINDGLRAIVSEITVDFSRGSCDPELSNELEKIILKDYTVVVNPSKTDKPSGRVHWLRNEQPEACTVEKLNISDIQMNAKKWLDGKWGRKTASDPTKAPKQ